MILTGIGDEGANTIDGQIQATRELGWHYLEPRGVEVSGFSKANFHDIPDPAFDLAVRKLETAGIGVYCFGSTIMNWSKKVADPQSRSLQNQTVAQTRPLGILGTCSRPGRPHPCQRRHLGAGQKGCRL